MKITLVQFDIAWENRKANLEKLDGLLGTDLKTDLIVLPEMFTTGFSMDPANAELRGEETLNWMKQKAKQLNCAVTGSVSVVDEGKCYNRLFWVEANGNVKHYDKRHLFRMAGEENVFTMGREKITPSIKGSKIRPLICYDLRFPVWSRNHFENTGEKQYKAEYDMLLYVANWPAVRHFPWQQLLIARAIENQAFVVAVNRVGKDGNGYDHRGGSVILNPRGEVLAKCADDETEVLTADVDVPGYLNEFRKIFPVGLDADPFELR